jgi:hypothetical protein
MTDFAPISFDEVQARIKAEGGTVGFKQSTAVFM